MAHLTAVVGDDARSHLDDEGAHLRRLVARFGLHRRIELEDDPADLDVVARLEALRGQRADPARSCEGGPQRSASRPRWAWRAISRSMPRPGDSRSAPGPVRSTAKPSSAPGRYTRCSAIASPRGPSRAVRRAPRPIAREQVVDAPAGGGRRHHDGEGTARQPAAHSSATSLGVVRRHEVGLRQARSPRQSGEPRTVRQQLVLDLEWLSSGSDPSTGASSITWTSSRVRSMWARKSCPSPAPGWRPRSARGCRRPRAGVAPARSCRAPARAS